MFNMANLKWELWCYIRHTIKMRAIKCVYCCNWHLSSIMIYLFLNSLQNFLQHKVVLHDHQIMKSITINTKNKWYFKVCCALGWWLKFAMQSCFGATNWLPGCHGEKSCFIYNIYNYRVHFHQAIYQCIRMFDILVTMLMFAMSKNYLDWDHS